MAKVIDRLLKSLAADDPRAIYDLAQRELPEGAIIEPLVQEVPFKLPELDYWFKVSADGAEWADVFEFKARYVSHMQAQVFDYSLRARLATGLPVNTTIIVAMPERFPKRYREIPPIEIPRLIRNRYHTVKLWEAGASTVLESRRPGLPVLVPFMRARWDQLVEAGRRAHREGADAARWYWKAVGMKYPEEEQHRLRADVAMNNALLERWFAEIYPVSPQGKKEIAAARKKARKEGREEGLEQGRVEQARQMVQMIIQTRFSEIGVPELESVNSLEELNQVALLLARARNAREARAAIKQLSGGRAGNQARANR